MGKPSWLLLLFFVFWLFSASSVQKTKGDCWEGIYFNAGRPVASPVDYYNAGDRTIYEITQNTINESRQNWMKKVWGLTNAILDVGVQFNVTITHSDYHINEGGGRGGSASGYFDFQENSSFLRFFLFS
ncbi:MAG: hypothetical protein ACE5OZ_15700 [Candidatus Heimdallarchaeota archaeon]